MNEVQSRGSSAKQDEGGAVRRGVTGGQETPGNTEKHTGWLAGWWGGVTDW